MVWRRKSDDWDEHESEQEALDNLVSRLSGKYNVRRNTLYGEFNNHLGEIDLYAITPDNKYVLLFEQKSSLSRVKELNAEDQLDRAEEIYMSVFHPDARVFKFIYEGKKPYDSNLRWIT